MGSAAVLFSTSLGLASCAAQPLPLAQPVQSPQLPEALTGPWVVAIQPGHWKIEELPDELYRLRGSTGTAWGRVREVDINRTVAEALVELVRGQGWTPVLVPATVPPGLRADVFLSIHADGSADTTRTGWKLAPPWRSSLAGLALAQALSNSFQSQSDLKHDEDGITINMRGYFGFSHRRFVHAVSPHTPSVLVELGFVTNERDRRLLTAEPRRFARLLLRGLESYFAGRPRDRTDDLLPREFPRMIVGPAGAQVVSRPEAGSRPLGRGLPGTALSPVGESGDWYEVSLRSPRVIGWVSKGSLLPAAGPYSPPSFR